MTTEHLDNDRPTAETLPDLRDLFSSQMHRRSLDIIRWRSSLTLNETGLRLDLTRQRVQQLEQEAMSELAALVQRSAPHMARSWEAQLAERVASELELFSAHLSHQHDIKDQFAFGRAALRASVKNAAVLRVFGRIVSEYWALPSAAEELESCLAAVQEAGPHTDEGMLTAFAEQGVDVDLGLLVLERGCTSLVHSDNARGWVRRSARKRDAAYLQLERIGKPMGVHDLAAILGEPPEILDAHLARDERFQKLYGARKWAIANWDNSSEGGLYRSTFEALESILSRGPATWSSLASEVHSVHGTSNAAVSTNLEHERFAKLPDGRYCLAEFGGVQHEDREPALGRNVAFAASDDRLLLRVPLDSSVLRGSGISVSRYVTWFLGLRRVPSSVSLKARVGGTVVVGRKINGASVSSLRTFAQRLNLTEGCVLELEIDAAKLRVEVRPVCKCHRTVDTSRR